MRYTHLAPEHHLAEVSEDWTQAPVHEIGWEESLVRK